METHQLNGETIPNVEAKAGGRFADVATKEARVTTPRTCDPDSLPGGALETTDLFHEETER